MDPRRGGDVRACVRACVRAGGRGGEAKRQGPAELQDRVVCCLHILVAWMAAWLGSIEKSVWIQRRPPILRGPRGDEAQGSHVSPLWVVEWGKVSRGEGNSPCQRRRWRPPVSYSFRIGIKDAAIRRSAPSHIAPPRDSVFGQLVINSMSALDRCKLQAWMRYLHPESRSREGGVIGGGECVCRCGLMGDRRSVGERRVPGTSCTYT